MLSLALGGRLNRLWCGAKDSPVRFREKNRERRPGPFVFARMTPWFKRLSPPALCAMFALAGGMMAGTTAVYGLRQNSYGPVDPPMLISRSGNSGYGSGYAAGNTTDEGYDAGAAAGCEGCSERDLGYRWATLQAIQSATECPNDSWGFRRGCLDYTGGV